MKTIIKMITLALFVTIMNVSCSSGSKGDENKVCDRLTLTIEKYSDEENLNKIVKDEFEGQYIVADWTDLEKISDLDEWISCMELENNQRFMLAKDGNFGVGAKRQYFVAYFENGDVPSNWQVHAKLDDKLFLGSWYGMNLPVLCKKK